MSVNVVTYSSSGGAGKVAGSLVEGFSKIGLESNLIIATQTDLRSNPEKHPELTLSAAVDQFAIKSREWNSLISLSRDKRSVLQAPLPNAELTIFRWMNGLLGNRFTRENADFDKLVWGLDDMNPFTGVCHYSGSCRSFEISCKECPAVRMPFRPLVRHRQEEKIKFADRHRPAYVAPTEWMHDQFKKSKIGKERVSKKILNPVQTKFFENHPIGRSPSKKIKLLVIAANLDDPTKGLWGVTESLNAFLKLPNTELTLVGRHSERLAKSMPTATFLGPVDSDLVIQQMRLHDALVTPSLFENAATVIAEAASQGLPVVARGVGGIPEMTNYGENGYLFNSDEEVIDILSSFSISDLKDKGRAAKDWAQMLRPELIATQYAEAFL